MWEALEARMKEVSTQGAGPVAGLPRGTLALRLKVVIRHILTQCGENLFCQWEGT